MGSPVFTQRLYQAVRQVVRSNKSLRIVIVELTVPIYLLMHANSNLKGGRWKVTTNKRTNFIHTYSKHLGSDMQQHFNEKAFR